MKKTLSVFLSVLVLLSVFSVAAFAAEAPELKDLKCTFDGVELSWTGSADAVNYLVYRAEGADGELDCIATTTKTKYVDKDVTVGKIYKYTVTVVNADGSYTKPNLADAKTVLFAKAPCAHEDYKWVIDYRATVYASGLKHKECNTCHEKFGEVIIPQLVTATPVLKTLANRTNGVYVSWTEIEGATSYNVYRRGAGEKWKLIRITAATSIVDKTVENGKIYRYTIKARNAAGLSPYVDGKAIKFIESPVNIKANNTPGGIKVTWTAVEGATSYRVYRKALGDTSWTLIGTTKKAYYGDVKVEAAQTYTYTVRAVSGKNISYFYAGESEVRLERPALVSAKSSSEGITVSWEKVDGAKGYYVYRKTANSGWVRIGTVKNVRSSAYLDKSTTKGVKYTYTVRAFNGDSRSYYYTDGITCKDVH